MIQACTLLIMLLFSFTVSDACAETYTWTDEQGTVHFTENPESVPTTIRKKARRTDETGPLRQEAPASQAPSAEPRDKAPEAAPSAGAGDSAPAEVYAGKTFAQWKKDFTDREAAMAAIRKRIVEITVLMAKPATRSAEKEQLLAEHATLLEQFNEMKAMYDQQVEIARKAGLQITIQR